MVLIEFLDLNCHRMNGRMNTSYGSPPSILSFHFDVVTSVNENCATLNVESSLKFIVWTRTQQMQKQIISKPDDIHLLVNLLGRNERFRFRFQRWVFGINWYWHRYYLNIRYQSMTKELRVRKTVKICKKINSMKHSVTRVMQRKRTSNKVTLKCNLISHQQISSFVRSSIVIVVVVVIAFIVSYLCLMDGRYEMWVSLCVFSDKIKLRKLTRQWQRWGKYAKKK